MRFRKYLSLCLLCVLLCNSTVMLNPAPVSAATVIPINPQPPAVAPKKVSQSPTFAQLESVSHSDLRGPSLYIILLEHPPVASYRGGIAGLDATNPQVRGERKLDVQNTPSRAYAAHLDALHAQTLTEMELVLDQTLTVEMTYKYALNGLVVELTPEQATEVAKLAGVQQVIRDFVRYPTTEYSADWIGAPGIWDGTATGVLPGTKGEGLIVGVIDTGINMDHASFADIGGDGYDHDNPLGAGNYVGLCDSQPGTYTCNDKLIGVWGFTTTGDPEDDDGHGSHTASTAAGNAVSATIVAPTYTYSATITGVAPHANIIAYDACISGAGCAGTALIASIEQTIVDGVDVINYSIGGGSVDPWNDTEAMAFLAAMDAGIVPVTSAGNDGPSASTVGSPADAPWMLSVGATTHNREFRNALINMTGGDTTAPADIIGGSVTGDYGPATIVHAKDYDGIADGAAGDGQCLTPFPANTWTNEIVVCDRGEIARVEKAENVAAGDAAGFVLVNVDPDENWIANDMYVIPGVHIKLAPGAQLKTWLDSGAGHIATIQGTWADVAVANADLMGDFSSRGPNVAVPDLLKPDIAAPGVTILAASMNGTEFETMGGTSMASPHVAGAATLLYALHPTWTPAQIKSALMMTAWSDTLLKEDAVTPADPFDMGSGRVDLSAAAKAGLLLDETEANFTAADPASGGDPKTLNVPSMANADCYNTCSWRRTVSSALSGSTTWTVRVEGAPPGLDISVSPDNFTLGSSATRDLDITADVTGFNVAVDGTNGWGFAHIVLESIGQEPLHMPVAVKKNLTSAERLIVKTTHVTETDILEVYTYTIVLNNRDNVTNTYWLTDTLPADVSYMPGTASPGLIYDAGQHQLTWRGEIGPGAIDYTVTSVDHIPYHNLDNGGICAGYFPTDCDDVNISVPLSPDVLTFYGEQISEPSVSSNSMIFGPEGWLGSACQACNQHLPEPTEINQVIAGLWRDVNMTGGNGDFYIGILTGWLPNAADKVLYVNWHDVGQYDAPAITTRHAIAVVLDEQSEPAGRIYYVYDDITGDLSTHGYTVGVENKYGDKGITHAYEPCSGGSCVPGTPAGTVPANETTLRLDPVLSGESNVVTLTYQVMVTVPINQLVTNAVAVTSNSVDPAAQSMWARADVNVRLTAPVPQWNKTVLLNNVPVAISDPITLTSGDTITIVDQVNVANADPITFTLTETWGDAVVLQNVQHDSGTILTTTTSLDWAMDAVAPNTDYVLTKTFIAQGGVWLSDLLTESLLVQDALPASQIDDKVLSFVHGCEPVTWVDFDWTPAFPQTGDLVTLTATTQPMYADQPVSFDWTIEDRTPTGNEIYHTFTLSDTYSVSVEAHNACGGPVWMTHPIVVSGSLYHPQPNADFDPITATQSADPGETAVYTLTLYNSGETPDTYDLTLANVWPATVTPAMVDMMRWTSTTVTVSVTVPSEALADDLNAIMLLAEAQQHGVTTTSLLTTTANAVYSLTLEPATATQSAFPGEWVTTTLWLTNTGNATDAYTLTASGNTWPRDVPSSVSMMGQGLGVPLEIGVQVPAATLAGAMDTLIFTAISENDSQVSVSSIITTSADAVADLAVTVPVDAQAANPAQSVDYTLYITNTGNSTDTFSIAIADDTWATSVPASTGVLVPDAGTTVIVNVTVDAAALAGEMDVISVTLTSTTNATVSETRRMTTTANAVNDFNLTPASAAQTGVPGALVTYTLTLFNEGNVADSYDIISLSHWAVTVSTSLGPVAPFTNIPLTVTIEIPSDIANGALDTAIITVTSQNTPTLLAASVLTTTGVYPREYGVELAPASASQTATPGDSVTYTLRLTNTGNFTDSFMLATSGNAWTTMLPASVDALAMDAGIDVLAVVAVPVDAVNGAQDVVNVVATSADDPTTSATSRLTTVVAFSQTLYTLIVTTTGSGTGSVIPAVGDHSYVAGTTAVLTATADAGSVFVGWTGDADGSASTTSVVMDNHKTATAIFNLSDVCVAVADVTLTQITMGDVYTDSVVQFSGAIAPTTAIPYTYTMDFGAGASVPTATLAVSLTWNHTFVTVGTHSAIFSAWNCTMTLPLTATVSVNVSPQPTTNFEVYLPLVMRE